MTELKILRAVRLASHALANTIEQIRCETDPLVLQTLTKAKEKLEDDVITSVEAAEAYYASREEEQLDEAVYLTIHQGLQSPKVTSCRLHTTWWRLLDYFDEHEKLSRSGYPYHGINAYRIMPDQDEHMKRVTAGVKKDLCKRAKSGV